MIDRILIIRDFNIHVCCDSTVLVKGFLSLTDACDFAQWVKEPRHTHGHILDLAFLFQMIILVV